MSPNYEIIRYKQGLSANIVVHSVNRMKLHWHQELELLLVLRGCVSLMMGGKSYELRENDLFLVNPNEIHSTMANGDNILIAIQINPDFCSVTFPELRDSAIDCVSLGAGPEEAPIYGQIRTCVARMIVEYNKSGNGYQLAIEGILNTMLAMMVRGLPVTKNGGESAGNDKDLLRVKRIMEYVQEHYADKITLEDISKSEYLSTFYLSHFFKEKVGLPFQKYLNLVRLQMAVVLLDSTDRRISDIALDTGFAGVKAFNKVFGDFYCQTPSEYRRTRIRGVPDAADPTSYMEFDSIKAMEKLQEYLDAPQTAGLPRERYSVRTVGVSPDAPAQPLVHYWRRVMTVGRAYDCLRQDLQEQIRTAARELRFQTIRFHGIFSDEMRVLDGPDGGCCWQYVDKVLDFLLDAGLRPFFDLTFMPSAIAGGGGTLFHYRANISMPKSPGLWTGLIDAFARHLLDRYGRDEVRRWYFEIWNEPDYIWTGTQQQYFDFFAATAGALHAVDPALRIAGPSILQPMGGGTDWLDRMVEFLNQRDIPLDAFTFHFYGESDVGQRSQKALLPLLGGADYLTECLDIYTRSLEKLKHPVTEVLLTEFNISAFHGNLLLDTMFPACYILRAALRNRDRLDGLGFWTVSDIFEEDQRRGGSFDGGFGMMTVEGIKKPSYYAYRFLALLGDELLHQEDGLVVTRRGESYQALCYNFVFYDRLFRSGDRSMLSPHHRYEVFEDKPAVNLTLRLQGVSGSYRITRQLLDREHGSAFDCFLAMGAPDSLSPDEADYLRQSSVPRREVSTATLAGDFTESFSLQPHGILLLTLDKQY